MSLETPLLAQATHDLDIARIALFYGKRWASEVYARRCNRRIYFYPLTHPWVVYDRERGARRLRRKREKVVKELEAELAEALEMVGRLKKEREGVEAEAEAQEDDGCCRGCGDGLCLWFFHCRS